MTERPVLRVYDPLAATLLDTLTDTEYQSLQFTDEAGGGGGITFTVPTALVADPDYYDDAVVLVDIDDGAGGYDVAPYGIRGETRRVHTIGRELLSVRGRALLPVVAGDATVRPEFTAAGEVPRGAGEQRHLSWAGSLYDPDTDPSEPWDAVLESPRGTGSLPTDPVFPAGTGAAWITVATPANGARKFLRAWLTITGENTTVRCWFSADETSQVIVGGQPIIQTDTVEVGKVSALRADLVLQPGTYAVAVDTVTHVTKGGDGTDPVLVAICELEDDGTNGTWLLVSNDTDWVACRRPVTGAGSEPPGPTPGAVARTLIEEAQARGVSFWPSVTLGFTDTVDTDAVPWSTTEERVARLAFDPYALVFDGLADVACDMRLTNGLELQARVFEGGDATSVVIEAGSNVEKDESTSTAIRATVVDAYTVDGWVTVAAGSAVGRREMGLSLGSAPSLSQGRRVAGQALEELAVERSDNDVSFIAATGCVPYVDFWPGDTITHRRPSGDTARRVLSLTGTGSGPVRWSAELGEAFL